MKDNIFGKNLQAAREIHYRTKKEFANAIGIPETTYCQYENGRREPKYDLLVEIADKLDISLDELLRSHSDYAYKQTTTKIELSNDVKNYIQKEIQNSLKRAVSMI